VAIAFPLTRGLGYALRAAGFGFALYDFLFSGSDEVDPLEWRRVTARFQRSGDDDVVVSFDLLNVTAGGIDVTWTTGDYTAAETLLDAFFTTYKPYFSTTTTLIEYRWYRMEFRPVGDPRPFVPSVVPSRLSAKSIVGTGGTSPMPRQIACVVTERTPLPKHWGRAYLPMDGLATPLGASGQIPGSGVAAILAAANTLYRGLWAADLIPVVAITQVNGDPARALLPVTALVVDSVPDVQRRRRTAVPGTKSVVSLV
jgi:hypothetical protein